MLTIFNKAVTTNVGRALLAESVATETPLQFTAMVTGSGSYTDEQKTVAALEVMTALKSQKQSFPISHLSRTTDYEAVIKSVLTNTGLAESYVWNEVGLYAKLEGSAADPILYTIAVVAGSQGSEIPAYSSSTILNVVQSMYLSINNSTSVSILVNDSFEMLDDAGFNDDLNTTEKGTLVGAINELVGKIGDLTTLDTTATSDLVAAINELAAAVARKGVHTVTKSGVSSLPVTITDPLIKADMKKVDQYLSNGAAQTGEWTVTPANGSVTISGTISGTTDIEITLADTF